MQLQHEFSLPLPPGRAWDTLLDVPRVARCMPGATLDRADGDEFSGRVTLKVGPLRMAYLGELRILDRDAAARRLVLQAAGKEARGAGTAEATVTACLSDEAGGTLVALETELALTGRAARFGQGLVSEVAGTVIGQFADRLADEMRGGTEPAPGLPPAPPERAASAPASSGAALDVLSVLKPLLSSRGSLVLGVAAGALLAFLLGRGTGRRRPSDAERS